MRYPLKARKTPAFAVLYGIQESEPSLLSLNFFILFFLFRISFYQFFPPYFQFHSHIPIFTDISIHFPIVQKTAHIRRYYQFISIPPNTIRYSPTPYSFLYIPFLSISFYTERLPPRFISPLSPRQTYRFTPVGPTIDIFRHRVTDLQDTDDTDPSNKTPDHTDLLNDD